MNTPTLQTEVSSVIAEGEVNIERLEKVRASAQWQAVQLDLNTKLDDADEIEHLVVTAGIRIGYRFGTARPERRVIAIGALVPLENLQDILKLLGNRFEFLHLSRNHSDRIILGAYSYRVNNFGGKPLDDGLWNRLVNKEISQNELIAMLRKGAA